MVTWARLNELLTYDPVTGLFKWRVTRGSVKAGKSAGSPQGLGYLQIRIDRKLYLSHRLAWLYMTGEYPELEIDHMNSNRSDNRFENLRHVDPSTNMENERRARAGRVYGSTLGAFYRKDTGRWFSKITVKRKVIDLGYFPDEASAHAAYIEAKRRLHAGCTI